MGLGWMSGLLMAAMMAGAPAGGLMGDWLTQDGSVVRVAGCSGDAICLTVVKVNPKAPETKDAMNPDAGLRGRSLCGLRIGEGFKPDGQDTAAGGKLYDPVSGKTYSGKIARQGDSLKLRGYVGLALFGRTEVWSRTATPPPCR
jgi:uncharacterized protein (DUF2147 family)